MPLSSALSVMKARVSCHTSTAASYISMNSDAASMATVSKRTPCIASTHRHPHTQAVFLQRWPTRMACQRCRLGLSSACNISGILHKPNTRPAVTVYPADSYVSRANRLDFNTNTRTQAQILTVQLSDLLTKAPAPLSSIATSSKAPMPPCFSRLTNSAAHSAKHNSQHPRTLETNAATN